MKVEEAADRNLDIRGLAQRRDARSDRARAPRPPMIALDDAKTVLANVTGTITSNPEAAFESATIEAAAVLWDQDFPAFSRYRRNLKERHVNLTLFDHALDHLRRGQRQQVDVAATLAGATNTLPTPQPWPADVDGATLLEELVTMFATHIVLPPGADVALALWVLFSHAIDAFDIAPRLAIASATKRCGKTTLIKLLAHLCRNALASSNITPAAVFRVIDAAQPTLLVDEADTFARINPALRGILNSGHDRAAAFVYRVEGGVVRSFCTFAAVAVAAIGRQPPTWRDRAIDITMRRKGSAEKVEELSRVKHQQLNDLARKAARWTVDNGQALQAAAPALPDGLDDRAANNWSVLISIADLCGSDWGARARAIAVDMSHARKEDELAIQLLVDLKEIFHASGRDKLSSQYMVNELRAFDHRPWRDQRLTTHKLGALLTSFEIYSHTVRVKSTTGKPTSRGFDLQDFGDAFARYCRDPDPCNSTRKSL
jgi:putative DNA primase/helicase